MSTRRKFLGNGSLAAASLFFMKPLKSVAQLPGYLLATSKTVSIFDLGNLSDWIANSPSLDEIASLKHVVQNYRKLNSNSLFILTGNNLDVKAGTRQDHLHLLKTLRSFGCDALIPGPTDLALGLDYYDQLIEEAGLQSLWMNNENDSLPVSILQKGYIKVGMIGVNGSSMSTASQINESATQLRKSGCKMVVAFFTAESPDKYNKKELDLASQLHGVDLLLSRNSPFNNHKLVIAKNDKKEEVLISFSGHYNGNLKKIDLTFNDRIETLNLSLSKVC